MTTFDCLGFLTVELRLASDYDIGISYCFLDSCCNVYCYFKAVLKIHLFYEEGIAVNFEALLV